MVKNLILPVSLFTSIMFFGCAGNKEEKPFETDPNFKKEFVDSNDMKLFYEFIDVADIEKIENGFDGLQIRVLRPYLEANYFKFYVFKKQKNEWTASVHNVFEHYFADNRLAAVEMDTVYKPPLSGWKNFENKIEELNIINLPHYETLGKIVISSGSEIIWVEISTKDFYRVYNYSYLDENKNTYKEMADMKDFLHFLEYEF